MIAGKRFFCAQCDFRKIALSSVTGFALIVFSLLFFVCSCDRKREDAQSPPVSTLSPFDPDNDSSAINSSELEARLGPIPKPSRNYRMGVIVKYLGNQYWQLLSEGMHHKATQLNITIDVQGGKSESDPEGQLKIAEAMLAKKYDALIVSPQTDLNLMPAITKARKAGILIVNVDDAVLPDAEHFIGPNQYENGVRVAKYFIERFKEGGQLAVIEGQAGVYAAKQRTKGFKDTLAGTAFSIVSSVPGDWDLQKSLSIASGIIKEYPEIKGFYCNNDIMALGVVEAVQKANKIGQILVFGTDGIKPAYDSIRAGELTGTIDSFPFITGQIAIEVALRLLEGQLVPRVIFSPQNLITIENVGNPFP